MATKVRASEKHQRLDRRRFLQLGSAAAITPWLSACKFDWGKAADTSLLLTGYRDTRPTATHSQAQYGVAGIHTNGQLAFDIPVAQRVHDSLYLPHSQQALFFARRPGTHLYAIDLVSGEMTHTLSAPSQRHFYGHGCISGDGRYLLTTENAYDRQQGCIGVYDVKDNFRRIDEFSSGGIGPHQIRFLADQKTVVVANGGILTHPSRGRKKLNLDSMQPSLTYLDSRSGQLLDTFTLAHPQQSIRHIDVSDNDQVAVGIQFEGDPTEQLPLAYTHSGEQQLQPLTASIQDWQRHQQYIGSVCLNPEGTRLLLSSPRGGIVSGWNLQTGALESIQTQRDGAGLAFTANEANFFVSNGIGQISRLGADSFSSNTQAPFYFEGRSWDNHMSVAKLSHSIATPQQHSPAG